MREIQLILLDSSDNYLGTLDLEKFSDFPLSLNKGIGNINDIAKRESVYSLDFEIPKTANNLRLLFGANYVNASGNSLKCLKKNKCRIIVDGNQIETGLIRIYSSEVDGMFSANFTGGNGDWVEDLSGVNLNELEWKALNNTGTTNASELYNDFRINTVNSLSVDNIDIVYPIIERNVGAKYDNGTSGNATRPQLYLRNVIIRMFEKIGRTVESNFLESDWVKGVTVGSTKYKGLSIDPAFNFTVDQDVIDATRVQAVTTETLLNTDYSLGEDGAGGVRTQTKYGGYFDNEILDASNLFTPATSKFVAPSSGTYVLNFDSGDFQWRYNSGGIWAQFTYTAPPTTVRPPQVIIKVVINNTSETVIDGTVIYDQSSTGVVQVPGGRLNLNISLSAGDVVTVWYEMIDDAFGFPDATRNAPSLDIWRFFLGLDAQFEIQQKAEILDGNTYGINSHIPKDIDCLTLLQDFKLMFNLYFSYDSLTKKIRIEPRDDYYQNLGASENITQLIDLSKGIVIDSQNEYSRFLEFRYKADSKDKYLQRWEEINDRIYGQYKHDFGEDYEKGTILYETKYLSPTIQTVTKDNIVTSVIRREWDDALEPLEINKGYNIRVFQVIQKRQYDSAGQPRRILEPITVTVGLMESFGEVETLNDYKLTFNGDGGLVDRFYGKTIANIEDFRRVECYIKMPLYKFRSLDLSRPVFVDYSIPQIQGYYIIEKVENYSLVNDDLVKVRLLKYKDYAPIVIDPSQRTNINENANNQQGTEPEYLYFVFDEGLATEYIEPIYDEDNGGGIQFLYNE